MGAIHILLFIPTTCGPFVAHFVPRSKKFWVMLNHHVALPTHAERAALRSAQLAGARCAAQRAALCSRLRSAAGARVPARPHPPDPCRRPRGRAADQRSLPPPSPARPPTRVVSTWFGLLNLNRILPHSPERWMILLERNIGRSVIILYYILYGRNCAVVLDLPVHLTPDTEVGLRCTPGGVLMRKTGCRFGSCCGRMHFL